MNDQAIARVEALYSRLAERLRRAGPSAGHCDACGRCCDFEAFDHRLFVTGPELMYLAAAVPGRRLKPMTTGRCPYNIAGKCTVYQRRFVPCRIFCCRGDSELQARLSEWALRELRSICEQLHIPYRYMDLAAALGTAAG